MLKAKQTRRDREDKEKALKELEKEDTTRLNAEIPTSLHQQIKLYAVKSNKTMTEVIIEVFKEYLSKNINE